MVQFQLFLYGTCGGTRSKSCWQPAACGHNSGLRGCERPLKSNFAKSRSPHLLRVAGVGGLIHDPVALALQLDDVALCQRPHVEVAVGLRH